MTATFIDVHTHIQQHETEELPGILARAEEAGVGAMVVAGVTVKDSRRCVKLAHQHDQLFAGVGVHPTDLTGPLTPADLTELDKLAADPAVVVMSETGVDHQQHVLERPAPSGRNWADIQVDAFVGQIEIAKKHGLPLVFHVREPSDDPHANSAWPVALRVLKEAAAGKVGGAGHYFQGNWQTARQLLDSGFLISLGKPLLRIQDLQEVVKKIPLDHILLETDSYPQPFKKNRAKWTEPKDIPLVAAKVAELQSASVDRVRDQTTRNALTMLGDHAAALRQVIPL